MSDWNATHYLNFADERTRPSIDLVARISIESPNRIVDLGCGPGNSTQVLRARWPGAEVLGVDNSPPMIEAAEKVYPDQQWLLADVSTWLPDRPFDIVFSNAALQWLPDHQVLIPQLFSRVAPRGALAFQIPSATFATIRTLIHEVSHDPAWTTRMGSARRALTMESPAFYYNVLAHQATRFDIWETEYQHLLPSKSAIIEWISSTGLRPFLAALELEQERHQFLSELHRRVEEGYELLNDGKSLFPFRRTFVIAYR